MKIHRFRLMITGNVHRMGFRHLALEYARSHGLTGLTGYIGNTIFIEAEGHKNPLNLFVEWCRKGPEGCVIENFEITEMEPLNSEEFIISPTHLAIIKK